MKKTNPNLHPTAPKALVLPIMRGLGLYQLSARLVTALPHKENPFYGC